MQTSLERKVMSAATAVTAASGPIGDEAGSMGARDVTEIPNGYDPADLPEPRDRRLPRSHGHLALTFMGRFYSSHDPSTALRGMALARGAGIEVSLDVVGPDAPWVVSLVESLGLSDVVRFHGYRPHAEALRIVAAGDVALVTLASMPGTAAIYPGKLFEYLGMGMPVLLVGPTDGVSARLIGEAGAGTTVGPADEQAVAGALAELAAAAQQGTLPSPDPVVVARFQRRALTQQLAGVLDHSVAGGRL
jgi:glycosyltransferase involved in cell wall biosynthesis